MSSGTDNLAANSLASTVGRLAGWIASALPPGEVASLRKLQPGQADCAAFWRLLALLPEGLPQHELAREEAEKRWAVVLQAMATMAGMHEPGAAFGRALAMADVAEGRFLRLLRASDSALADAVRVTAHQLAQKAIPSNQTELALLLLSDGRSDSETIRRRLARGYYAQLAKEA